MQTDGEDEICDVASIQFGSCQTEKIRADHYDLGKLNCALGINGDLTQFDGIIGADILDACRAIIDYKTYEIYLMRRQVNSQGKRREP